MAQAEKTYYVDPKIIAKVEREKPDIAYRGSAVIPDSCYLSPDCQICGEAILGEEVIVFYGSVIRADSEAMHIGSQTNIQEHCMLHANSGNPLTIGEHCTVGHGAILHGCTIGDNTMVGMNAVVLDGAKIGNNCAVAAGAVVSSSMDAPDGSLLIGVPARIAKTMSDEQIVNTCTEVAELNIMEAKRMLAENLMSHPTPELLEKIGAR